MERPRAKLEPHRYVSTTMSVDRTLRQRWVNGFKLAFFASVLFGLVGLPFSLAQDGIDHLLTGQGWRVTLGVWLFYLVAALLSYPILFDWLAAGFRIQFVRKAISRPVLASNLRRDPPKSPPLPPEAPPSA